MTANQDIWVDPTIRSIAQRVQAGPAQVIFRFAQHLGMLPLTGTTDPEHMTDDLKIDNFELTAEEVNQIEMIAV